MAEKRGKSKAVSILLSILPIGWTWLYTYQKDKLKFWLAFFVFVITAAMLVGSFWVPALDAGWWTILWAGLACVIWLWSFIDAATKNEAWYKNY